MKLHGSVSWVTGFHDPTFSPHLISDVVLANCPLISFPSNINPFVVRPCTCPTWYRTNPIARVRGSAEAGWAGESVRQEHKSWRKIYSAGGRTDSRGLGMRALLILGGLSLVLAAPQTLYSKPPPKSCHMELTKDKAGNEECFDAEPECNESCKPGEPVS